MRRSLGADTGWSRSFLRLHAGSFVALARLTAPGAVAVTRRENPRAWLNVP